MGGRGDEPSPSNCGIVQPGYPKGWGSPKWDERRGSSPRGQQRHVVGQGVPESGRKLIDKLLVATSVGRNFIVATNASRFVFPHAIGDQIDLITEVIVQDAVCKSRILGYVAQARARVAQLRECIQGSFSQLRLTLRKLIR